MCGLVMDTAHIHAAPDSATGRTKFYMTNPLAATEDEIKKFADLLLNEEETRG